MPSDERRLAIVADLEQESLRVLRGLYHSKVAATPLAAPAVEPATATAE